MSYQTHSKTLALCLGVLVLAFALSYLVLAWTEPNDEPPKDNVPAPVNVGDIAQFKEGALGVGGLFVAYGGSNATTLVVVDSKVGIGTTTPLYKLDVNGSLNIGNSVLRLNGATGSAGQVLSSNGSQSQWSNIGDIIKTVDIGFPSLVKVFSSPGTTNWTVPAGVSRIKIEMWGGGGGHAVNYIPGAVNQGGASGAYNMGVFDVSSGQQYSVTVGVGGPYGANGFAGDGASSTVSGPAIPSNSFYAGGGQGGWHNGICYYGINPYACAIYGGSYVGGSFGINGLGVVFRDGDGPPLSWGGAAAPLGGTGMGIEPGSGGYGGAGGNGRVIIWY